MRLGVRTGQFLVMQNAIFGCHIFFLFDTFDLIVPLGFSEILFGMIHILVGDGWGVANQYWNRGVQPVVGESQDSNRKKSTVPFYIHIHRESSPENRCKHVGNLEPFTVLVLA